MKLNEKPVRRVPVVAQLTFSRSKVSLIAEETIDEVVKGSVGATVSPARLQEIKRECADLKVGLSLPYSRCKKKGGRR